MTNKTSPTVCDYSNQVNFDSHVGAAYWSQIGLEMNSGFIEFRLVILKVNLEKLSAYKLNRLSGVRWAKDRFILDIPKVF